jgi:hypothetical protein
MHTPTKNIKRLLPLVLAGVLMLMGMGCDKEDLSEYGPCYEGVVLGQGCPHIMIVAVKNAEIGEASWEWEGQVYKNVITIVNSPYRSINSSSIKNGSTIYFYLGSENDKMEEAPCHLGNPASISHYAPNNTFYIKHISKQRCN